MKIVTIKQSLQHVADNPQPRTDDLLGLPVHELVARTLFEIANGAKLGERNSLGRANVARNMILTRLVGKRRPGSHPATDTRESLEFIDLTGEAIEA